MTLSRRLAILVSSVWLFISGLFSSLIGAEEYFSDFEPVGRFLLTWLFVGVMPLGLVWGAYWVVSGYRLERRQTATDWSGPERFRQHLLAINCRKGLWRTWIVGTVVWYVYAVAGSGYEIGKWAGFHYSLLKETRSFAGAVEQKKNFLALAASCIRAQASTCWVTTDRPDPLFPSGRERIRLPNCEQTQPFRDVLTQELRARGVQLPPAGARGEACPDIVSMDTPEADWAKFWANLLAPLCFVAIYVIGSWIIKGFAKRFPQQY